MLPVGLMVVGLHKGEVLGGLHGFTSLSGFTLLPDPLVLFTRLTLGHGTSLEGFRPS